MKKIMIYGASGYTGRMVAAQARAAGMQVIVAGRNEAKLAALAATLAAEIRVFDLATPEGVAANLADVSLVLNCAGPFAHTAVPLMHACIEAGIHYLDITAEINVYRQAEALHQRAQQAGSMLMSGVGWDVVPTDCLAVSLARRVVQPVSLKIALQVTGSMSRGSAVSAGEIMRAGLLVRKNGLLVNKADAAFAEFDFGDGPVRCAPLSFGDLVTAWHSTGIADIEMYVHVTGDAFPEGDLSALPDGPLPAERDANRARAAVEITAADGNVHRAVIETVNGYSYTPLAAVAAAKRVLDGGAKPGFQTPASAFGADFAVEIAGTRLVYR